MCVEDLGSQTFGAVFEDESCNGFTLIQRSLPKSSSIATLFALRRSLTSLSPTYTLLAFEYRMGKIQHT